MTVKSPKGRHRRTKHRLTRTLATVLLIILLIGAPTGATMEPPAAYSATQER